MNTLAMPAPQSSPNSTTLLTLHPDLSARLAALLVDDLQPVLPDDIRTRLVQHVGIPRWSLVDAREDGGGNVRCHTLQVMDADKSSVDNVQYVLSPTSILEDDQKEEHTIPHNLLISIARWARHPKSQNSLRRAQLGQFFLSRRQTPATKLTI
jgi:hypothetical protein